MTRLDSAIRRLTAQRACLDAAAAMIGHVPGVVVELGLGNGRTYDHLRKRLPERRIFVFDRTVAAHPDCIPDDPHLILGDFRRTVPAAAVRWPRGVALLHADIGSGDKAASVALAAALAGAMAELMAPGGILVSDQPLPAGVLRDLPPPMEVSLGRYYLYAAGSASDRQDGA